MKKLEGMRYWLRWGESEGKKTWVHFLGFFMFNINGSGKKKTEIARMKFNKNETAKTWKLAELEANTYRSHM